MSGLTCRPRRPLIISIIQDGVIHGSIFGPPIYSWTRVSAPLGWELIWPNGKIADYVVTYVDRWLVWLQVAGVLKEVLRENFGRRTDWTVVLGLFPICISIHRWRCFDLFCVRVLARVLFFNDKICPPFLYAFWRNGSSVGTFDFLDRTPFLELLQREQTTIWNKQPSI